MAPKGDFDKKSIQEIELQAHGMEISKELSKTPVDKYEKRIKRLRRERKKIQETLQAKEREIDFVIEIRSKLSP